MKEYTYVMSHRRRFNTMLSSVFSSTDLWSKSEGKIEIMENNIFPLIQLKVFAYLFFAYLYFKIRCFTVDC